MTCRWNWWIILSNLCWHVYEVPYYRVEKHLSYWNKSKQWWYSRYILLLAIPCRYWKSKGSIGRCNKMHNNLKVTFLSLQNGRNGVLNHQPHDCLLNYLYRCRSKKTSKLRVTGLCDENSPETGEFPAQRVSNSKKCFHLMTSSRKGAQNKCQIYYCSLVQRIYQLFDTS